MKGIIGRLKKKGVVLTPQRLAVAEFLEDNTAHPTADEIYRRLKRRYPTISQATVYSSLEVLKQAGEIQPLTIRKGKVCFDSNPDLHHHFLCQECKRILDVEVSCPVAQQGCVDGHRVEGLQAYFYGVCAGCCENEKNKRR